MVNARISLGVAFLGKQVNALTSAKVILHAEMETATGKYLLSKITYQYNSDLMLNAKTQEIECANIVDVLQRLSKAVERKVQRGYVFDVSAAEVVSEDDEAWGSFKLGVESENSELDAIGAIQTTRTPSHKLRKHLIVTRGMQSKDKSAKLRLKRSEKRMAVTSVLVR